MLYEKQHTTWTDTLKSSFFSSAGWAGNCGDLWKTEKISAFLVFHSCEKKRIFLKLFQKSKTKCSWRIYISFHLSVGLKHKAVRMGRYRRIRKYRYCKNYQWRYLTSSWACVISGHHLKAKSTVVCGFSNVSCVLASGVLRDNEHW